ncbi:MAG: glutamate 5-kinase [Proteobacteria bacterium]|nr:glutamate 5-kinase [Pseudomonadota bacterium]
MSPSGAPNRKQLLGPARRVVVKLGSGVLSAGGDRLDAATLRRLAEDVAAERRQGREVVLVSSGAILAGRERLAMKTRPATTQAKQAAAAVGQGRLMRAWEEAFAEHDQAVAQVLLTREDFRHRRRYLNARNTILALLRLGVVPIINENDTIAVEEIKFGDNDVLSALVSGMCDAAALILLTDQDGLYSADPRVDREARLIERVEDGQAQARLGRSGPAGSGGMQSKVTAARMAASSGVPAFIGSGARGGVLEAILAGREEGTLFVPRPAPMDKRKQWLAFASHPRGQIHVDEGAREALVKRAKSLLPSGVQSLSKSFESGDVVSLLSKGVEFARGLTNYGSKELERIKGLKSGEIEGILGHKPADEVVHRDNLALL